MAAPPRRRREGWKLPEWLPVRGPGVQGESAVVTVARVASPTTTEQLVDVNDALLMVNDPDELDVPMTTPLTVMLEFAAAPTPVILRDVPCSDALLIKMLDVFPPPPPPEPLLAAAELGA